MTHYMYKGQKIEAKDVVLPNVLDYILASEWIKDQLGFDPRNCGEFFSNLDKSYIDESIVKEFAERGESQWRKAPYLDYWHYFIDIIDLRGNDTYVTNEVSFTDIYESIKRDFGEKNWRTYIAKVWADEYPDTYKLWMSW